MITEKTRTTYKQNTITCPHCGKEIPIIEVEKIVYQPPAVMPWPPSGPYIGPTTWPDYTGCGHGGAVIT